MREQEHAVAADEPRAVDDRRIAVEHRRHQRAELGGIELEVRVLDRHDTPSRARNPEAQRVSLSAVSIRVNDRDRGMGRQRVQHRAGAVSGAVVDDDDFARRRKIDREQAIDDRGDRPRFVEDRDDDRDERPVGRGHSWMVSFAMRPLSPAAQPVEAPGAKLKVS